MRWLWIWFMAEISGWSPRWFLNPFYSPSRHVAYWCMLGWRVGQADWGDDWARPDSVRRFDRSWIMRLLKRRLGIRSPSREMFGDEVCR